MRGELRNIHGSVLVEGDCAVCLCWEGEGWAGEYRPGDPDDEPLLRVYALRRRPDRSWKPHLAGGSSGLTRLTDRLGPDERQAALERFMRTLRPLMAFRHVGFRAALRRLSRLTWDDIRSDEHLEV